VSAAKVWTVALIGNPNTGKTTLFNALTGLRQQVGNYPGVTVERKVGSFTLADGVRIDLVDLPGTYSLAARSPDEMIAVDVLLGQQDGAQKIDAILAIADASNPERNFYLISQLFELNLPVVVALNMMDVAQQKGIYVDPHQLQSAMGAQVVAICANKSKGLDDLRAALGKALADGKPPIGTKPQFPATLETEISALHSHFQSHAADVKREINRLEAFRILVDKGGFAEERLAKVLGDDFKRDLDERRKRASSNPLPAEEVRARYTWARQVLAGAVTRPERPVATHSDTLDKILTHWFFGTLIFAVLMLVVFQSIFTWAEPLMGGIESIFGSLGEWVGGHMLDGALKSLIVDGVIGGVGGVLVFLPQICILFFFVAVLEDCGYMSRAAFLMDRMLSRVGLSGKSFIPMLSSFACAIPGIMATRTIENRRDRFATILIAPLMSCSARLPVYGIMIRTFIPDKPILGEFLTLHGVTLFAMYAVGILVAVPVAWILKKTLLKGETPPFLIELPSYKIPDWRTVVLRVLDRGKAFVLRAGTIIFAVSVIVWALAYFPRSTQIEADFAAKREAVETEFKAKHEAVEKDASLAKDAQATALKELDGKQEEAISDLSKVEEGEQLRQSYFGRMGHAVEGVFKPIGWDWRISMAALASFPAREVIVGTLGQIFNLGKEEDDTSENLRDALRDATWQGTERKLFNIPVALSVMVFFALCSQCAATLAAIKRETNSWFWPVFSFVYMTVLAYVASFVVYQATMAMGWGVV